MKILVTGGTGFIGSKILEVLGEEGYQAQKFEGDITKIEDWEDNLKPGFDAIIHVAGVRTETGTDLKVNLGGVEALKQALLTISKTTELLIFISSQAVYIGTKPPFKEDLKLTPKTLYGISKLRAENLVRQIGEQYHIRTVIFRPSPVLGKGVREKSRMSGPLYSFMQKALENEDIDIFQDGNQTRDYVNVADVVKAILLAIRNQEMEGIFNIGGGKRVKVIELAELIKEAAGSRSVIVVKGGEASFSDPKEMFSDTTKLEQFGWKAQESLRDAIKSLFD